MQLSIKTTNIEMTAALKAYVEKKLGALEKYMKRFNPEAVDMRVEVGKETEHHRKGPYFRAEVNLRIPGAVLYADANHENLYAAVDLVHDETKKEIIKNKEKRIAKDRPRVKK